jgi:protein O-GlcNAc transferase
VVFWCSQAVSKYLPQFDQVFARIAGRVADCQFVFIKFAGAEHVSELLRMRLARAFASAGLDADRHIVMLPRLDGARYAAAAGLCDVGLDSIGWSGCNSTLECLAQDLPIVTWPGELMRSRHTAAILTMMDVTDTIAGGIDDYVAIAVRLALDRTWRDVVKAKIAANLHRVMRDRACIAALEAFLIGVAQGEGEPRDSR